MSFIKDYLKGLLVIFFVVQPYLVSRFFLLELPWSKSVPFGVHVWIWISGSAFELLTAAILIIPYFIGKAIKMY